MNINDLVNSVDEQNKEKEKLAKEQRNLNALESVKNAVAHSSAKITDRISKPSPVAIKNLPSDLAKSKDLHKVGDTVNELTGMLYLNQMESMDSVSQAIYELATLIESFPKQFKAETYVVQTKDEKMARQFGQSFKFPEEMKVNNLHEVTKPVQAQVKTLSDKFSELIKQVPPIHKSLTTIQKNDTSSLKLANDLIAKVQAVSKQLEALNKGVQVTNLKDIKIPVTDAVRVTNLKDIPTVECEDIYEVYKPADSDSSDKAKYYGYLDRVGNWFIFQIHTDTKQQTAYRFATGDGNYKQAWKQRKLQDYRYYNEVIFHALH